MPLPNVVSVGVVISSHGVLGHLKIRTEDHSVEIEKGTWCFVEIQKKPVPFFVEDSWGGDGQLILKLKDIDSPEGATFFRNRSLLLNRDYVKAITSETDDVLGPRSWKGFRIESAEGGLIGIIVLVLDNSGQWLFDLESAEGHNVLIPFHEDFLVKKDEENRLLVMKIPDGLLNL